MVQRFDGQIIDRHFQRTAVGLRKGKDDADAAGVFCGVGVGIVDDGADVILHDFNLLQGNTFRKGQSLQQVDMLIDLYLELRQVLQAIDRHGRQRYLGGGGVAGLVGDFYVKLALLGEFVSGTHGLEHSACRRERQNQRAG